MLLQIALEGYQIRLVQLDILEFYAKPAIFHRTIQLLGILFVVHAGTKWLIHLKSLDYFYSM